MSEFHEMTLKDLAELARISNSKPFAEEEGKDPFSDRFFYSPKEELNEFLRFKDRIEDWLAAREAAFRVLAGERVLLKLNLKAGSEPRSVLLCRNHADLPGTFQERKGLPGTGADSIEGSSNQSS